MTKQQTKKNDKPGPSANGTAKPLTAAAEPPALREALDEIAKLFGSEAIMRLGDRSARPPVEVIPTGALALDAALGVGGLPRGRIVEIFGPEMSGKTTLVYHVLAEAQRAGGACAFVDAEHAMDPDYAEAIGVQIDQLLVSQPDHGEQALEIADTLTASGELAVVAIDSVAALVPKAELEGRMDDQQVGAHARMMAKALRKLAGTLNRTGTLLLLTNQLREKIGNPYGPSEIQPGGRALKFYASQRLDIRRIETLKDGKRSIGNRVRVRVVKNKLAPPFREAEFDVDYGRGISTSGCVLDLAVEHGVIERRGAHFHYGQAKLGHGRAAAKARLDEDPELAAELASAVRAALGIEGGTDAPGEGAPPADLLAAA
jgi:recombination protein RecA